MEERKFVLINEANQIEVIIATNDPTLEAPEGLRAIEVPTTLEVELILSDYKKYTVALNDDDTFDQFIRNEE